jgi:hypothetical protein
MPSAAPSEIARGAAMGRTIPDYFAAPPQERGRQVREYSSRPGAESRYRFVRQRYLKVEHACGQLSVFRVERGRLGGVVSLVGDCRPPPPGNPRRAPSDNSWASRRIRGAIGATSAIRHQGDNSVSTRRKHRGIILLGYQRFSYINSETLSNLKKSNTSEYFKNNRSYFYCTEKRLVLESGSLHSHLCGLMEVELPSIAITNVLEIRNNLCAALIVNMMNPG